MEPYWFFWSWHLGGSRAEDSALSPWLCAWILIRLNQLNRSVKHPKFVCKSIDFVAVDLDHTLRWMNALRSLLTTANAQNAISFNEHQWLLQNFRQADLDKNSPWNSKIANYLGFRFFKSWRIHPFVLFHRWNSIWRAVAPAQTVELAAQWAVRAGTFQGDFLLNSARNKEFIRG